MGQSIFPHILLAFTAVFMQAAATLPIIAALSLIAGRRGNAHFCAGGALRLLHLAQLFGISGPCWLLGSYFLQIAPYGAPFSQMLAPLFEAPGMPWSSSLIVWLAGWLACFYAAAAINKIGELLPEGGYALKAAYFPLFFALAAGALFFTTFMLINWPFAGLPQDMDYERVIMALWRHATSSYFLAFSAAGGLALCALPWLGRRLDAEQLDIATRWLSFWGAAGAAPTALTGWLAALGAARAASAASQGLEARMLGLGLLTAALACWAILIWKPRYQRWLAWPAAALLMLKAVPQILMAWR